MADGITPITVDWSQAPKPADIVGGYANAFKTGQALAQASAVQNAYRQNATDPAGAVSSLIGAGALPEAAALGNINQKTADQQTDANVAPMLAAGNTQGAVQAYGAAGKPDDVLALQKYVQDSSAAQLAQASKNHEIAASVAGSLATQFPAPAGTDPTQTPANVVAQRQSAAVHVAQTAGYPDAVVKAIAGADYTDAGLAALRQSNLSAKDQMDMALREKTLQLDDRKETFEEGKPVYHFGQPGEVATLESGSPGGAPPAAAPGGNVPRGLRNNNPLNVTSLPDGQWSGQSGTDGQYATFASPQAGWAAADKNLASYGSAHGINTIAGVVSRWAPAGKDGNNPAQYAATVAKALGVDPDAQINLADPAMRQKVLTAMAAVENGQPVAYGQGAPAPAPGATPAAQAGGLPTRVGQSTVIGTPDDGGAPGKAGDIGSIPAADRSFVQAMIDGRYPAPTGFALKDPTIQRYIREATQVDPSYNAETFKSRSKNWEDISSTKLGTTGGRLVALNQGLFHADNLADDIERMNNTPLGGVNFVKNAFSNPFTGNTTALATDAKGLSAEIAKVFQGGAPHEAEVKSWLDELNKPDASPVEQRTALQHVAGLLHGSIQAILDQYKTGMSPAMSQLTAIHPQAAQALQRLETLQSKLSGGKRGASASRPAPDRHGNVVLGAE